MIVAINGDKKDIKENSSISNLLKELDILSKVAACAINTHVVKKDKWDKTILNPNDEIEFLQFVGGG
jgi:sulfur carrier protein